MLLEARLKTTFSFSAPNAPFSQSLSHIATFNRTFGISELPLVPQGSGK